MPTIKAPYSRVCRSETGYVPFSKQDRKQLAEAMPPEDTARFNRPRLEEATLPVQKEIQAYTLYQRWKTFMEMLYVLVVEKTPILNNIDPLCNCGERRVKNGLGDGGTVTYYVTSIKPSPEGDCLVAHEATHDRSMAIVVGKEGWSFNGAQCHLTRVDGTPTEQFGGRRISRRSFIYDNSKPSEAIDDTYQGGVEGEEDEEYFGWEDDGELEDHNSGSQYVKFTEQPSIELKGDTVLPCLLKKYQVAQFVRLNKNIDDVIDRLNVAQPWYGEKDLGKEKWFFSLNEKDYDRAEDDGGNEVEDPLNPIVKDRVDAGHTPRKVYTKVYAVCKGEVMDSQRFMKAKKEKSVALDITLPYREERWEQSKGLLPQVAVTLNIHDNKGEKRLAKWKWGDMFLNYRKFSDYELRLWLLSHIHGFKYDSFESVPAYGPSSKPGSSIAKHYCRKCKKITNHRIQGGYIYCYARRAGEQNMCHHRSHFEILRFTFKANHVGDPIPFFYRSFEGKNAPMSISCNRQPGDVTWSIEVPFYPKWENTEIQGPSKGRIGTAYGHKIVTL